MGRGKGTTESKISMKGERVREGEREKLQKKRKDKQSSEQRQNSEHCMEYTDGTLIAIKAENKTYSKLTVKKKECRLFFIKFERGIRCRRLGAE